MEELSKIAEIIEALGEQGKTVFIFWLVADMVKTLAWATIVGCALWALFKRVGQAVANAVKARHA